MVVWDTKLSRLFKPHLRLNPMAALLGFDIPVYLGTPYIFLLLSTLWVCFSAGPFYYKLMYFPWQRIWYLMCSSVYILREYKSWSDVAPAVCNCHSVSWLYCLLIPKRLIDTIPQAPRNCSHCGAGALCDRDHNFGRRSPLVQDDMVRRTAVSYYECCGITLRVDMTGTWL